MPSRSLPDDPVETGALALSAVGGLLVAWFLLTTLRAGYPLCHVRALLIRGGQWVLYLHLPVLVGGAAVLAGAGLSARVAGRRRQSLAAVAALLGAALLGRVVVAVATCGLESLSPPGALGPYVVVPVAAGAVLAAAGWFLYARG